MGRASLPAVSPAKVGGQERRLDPASAGKTSQFRLLPGIPFVPLFLREELWPGVRVDSFSRSDREIMAVGQGDELGRFGIFLESADFAVI